MRPLDVLTIGIVAVGLICTLTLIGLVLLLMHYARERRHANVSTATAANARVIVTDAAGGSRLETRQVGVRDELRARQALRPRSGNVSNLGSVSRLDDYRPPGGGDAA